MSHWPARSRKEVAEAMTRDQTPARSASSTIIEYNECYGIPESFADLIQPVCCTAVAAQSGSYRRAPPRDCRKAPDTASARTAHTSGISEHRALSGLFAMKAGMQRHTKRRSRTGRIYVPAFAGSSACLTYCAYRDLRALFGLLRRRILRLVAPDDGRDLRQQIIHVFKNRALRRSELACP